MRLSKHLVLLALTLTLSAPAVLPATSLAQSVGDDQYVDPFQPDDNGNQGANQDNNTENQTGGGDQTNSVTQQTPVEPTTGSGEVATDAQTGTDDGPALPRTGLPLAGVALTGALMLAGGFTLRRRA